MFTWFSCGCVISSFLCFMVLKLGGNYKTLKKKRKYLLLFINFPPLFMGSEGNSSGFSTEMRV